jgi:hypothetical protein
MCLDRNKEGSRLPRPSWLQQVAWTVSIRLAPLHCSWLEINVYSIVVGCMFSKAAGCLGCRRYSRLPRLS